MQNDLLEEILESPRLPSLPTIALEVIELAQQPEVGIGQLATTIANDPALAGKILRSANSSFYAQSRTVGTLSRAVMVLGLNSVRTLALGFSLVDNLREQAESGFDHVHFWQRSLLAGITARSIAKEQRAAHPEEAFLGGLLHGLGVLTLARVLDERYGSIFAAAEGRYERLRELEREELGLDHAQVGSALALHWKLPPQLTACLGFYAEPESAEQDARGLVRCVGLGVHGADVIVGASPGEALGAYRAGMQRCYGTAERDADDLLTRANDEAIELRRLFELPEQTQSASAMLERANAALLEISLQATQHGSQLEAENRALAAVASRDPLTGLANRYQLEQFLGQQCATAQRYRTPLSLAMVDLDHFKRINDAHGHQTGDRALIAVAAAIQTVSHELDLVARYGGEEFAVVMPLTGLAGALQGAERIRGAIERTTVPLADGTTVPLAASLGVALFGEGSDSPETLINAADSALYRAKAAGRNRVCEHTPQQDAA